jgi:hypothetical protein
MATKTVVCPECDTPVVPGRLSCSACGALVASVASAVRMFSPPEPAVPPVLQPATNPKQRKAKASEVRPLPDSDDAPLAGNVDDHPPEDPRVAVAAEPVAKAVAWPEPVAGPIATPEPARTPDVLAAVQPSWPETPAWPPQRPPSVPVVQDPAAASRVLAGAYLPPSAVLPPGEALPLPNGAQPATPAPAAAAPTVGAARKESRFGLGDADGPLGLPADAPIKTIAGGAGIAAFGFILPWAEIVIGSKAMGSYLDQWGLAGPSHPLVLLGLLVLGGVALAADRLPRWISPGLPAIGLGAFLVGLTWPYLTGPFRASIGVYVVVVGALVLIIGGLAHRAARRHEDATASV